MKKQIDTAALVLAAGSAAAIGFTMYRLFTSKNPSSPVTPAEKKTDATAQSQTPAQAQTNSKPHAHGLGCECHFIKKAQEQLNKLTTPNSDPDPAPTGPVAAYSR